MTAKRCMNVVKMTPKWISYFQIIIGYLQYGIWTKA
jgi:hypothetical protein